MAAQTGSDFESGFNHVSTGLFKDNTTNDISEADLRSFVTATRESYMNRIDNLALFSTDTSGSTITLDFGSTILAYERKFYGSASFATAKAVSLGNSTNAVKFEFVFEITNVAATLDFGSGSTFKMSDVRWDAATQVWTPVETGIFKCSGIYNGTNWFLDISQSPYV